MSSPTDTFKPLGAALASGTIEDVLACLDPDGTVVMKLGTQVTSLSGAGLHAEVASFLSAFESLSLTPVSRSLSGGSITEEAVFSGEHVGPLAGIEPTHRRVRFSVRLVAEAASGSTLHRLWVEPDAPALLAQISDTDDIDSVTAGLIATVRERDTHPVRVTGDGYEQVTPSARHRSRRPKAPRMRRRKLVIAAVLLAAAATAGWRLILPSGSPSGGQAASALGHPRPKATKATKAPKAPLPRKLPTKAVPGRQPVIATAGAKTVPKVQAGRQVVLSADVLFGPASSTVAPGAKAALLRIAQEVRRGKVRGTIQINGYTDSSGDSATNVALSKTRALAVARVLQPMLSGLQIVLAPQGFGASSPIATNSTKVGQSRNRRVTIVLPRH